MSPTVLQQLVKRRICDIIRRVEQLGPEDESLASFLLDEAEDLAETLESNTEFIWMRFIPKHYQSPEN